MASALPNCLRRNVPSRRENQQSAAISGHISKRDITRGITFIGFQEWDNRASKVGLSQSDALIEMAQHATQMDGWGDF